MVGVEGVTEDLGDDRHRATGVEGEGRRLRRCLEVGSEETEGGVVEEGTGIGMTTVMMIGGPTGPGAIRRAGVRRDGGGVPVMEVAVGRRLRDVGRARRGVVVVGRDGVRAIPATAVEIAARGGIDE